jgi:hypothetical protein
MIPMVAPNIARDATNGITISSPSIKGLLLIISTVPGLLSPKCMPGAVGLHYRSLAMYFTCKNVLFTIVKTNPVKTICKIISSCFRYIISTRPGVWSELDHADTLGKCRGSAWPIPGENAVPVSCRRSIQDKASKVKCPTLLPIWHSLAFPAALSCKAPIAVSFLLY